LAYFFQISSQFFGKCIKMGSSGMLVVGADHPQEEGPAEVQVDEGDLLPLQPGKLKSLFWGVGLFPWSRTSILNPFYNTAVLNHFLAAFSAKGPAKLVFTGLDWPVQANIKSEGQF
jgi:hypothetical protein